MTARYRLHGLLVESSLELDAARATPGGAADIEVREVPGRPADADEPVVCEIEVPAGTYVGRAGERGWSLTLGAQYAFRGSPDGHVRAWAAERNRAVLPALVAGNVLAFWLQLHGHAVFHASAVTVGGKTLAVAGPQGAGKTTLAAHLCAAGGELLTDDVLRVDSLEGGFVCHQGGSVLRLRPDVEHLADSVPHGAARRSWDGRLVLAAPAAPSPRRLDAIVLPSHVDDRSAEARIERLPPRQAAIELLGLPRWFGWRIEGPQRLHLRTAAEIAQVVPVYRLGLTPGAARALSGLARRVMEAVA